VVIDCKRRVRKLWGGYSPKVNDNVWLRVNSDQFSELFSGAIIAGDCHYSWGKAGFNDITFHVPFEEPKNKKFIIKL